MPYQLVSFRETEPEAVSQEQNLRSTVSYKIDIEISLRKYDNELTLSGKQIKRLPDLDM